MIHLSIDHQPLCFLVHGARHAGGRASFLRAEVTCPECLVVLDQFEERGLKPRRSKWRWFAVAKKNGATYRGRNERDLSSRRIVWREAPRAIDYPWGGRSVVALALHHGLRVTP